MIADGDKNVALYKVPLKMPDDKMYYLNKDSPDVVVRKNEFLQVRTKLTSNVMPQNGTK